jgi:hypothetical protein
MKTKHPVEIQWLNIKNKFKSDGYDLTEMETLTSEFIIYLTELTMLGHTHIGKTSIDAYKDRVWLIIENMGILPEYKDEEPIEIEVEDKWESLDDDEIYEINEEEFYL